MTLLNSSINKISKTISLYSDLLPQEFVAFTTDRSIDFPLLDLTNPFTDEQITFLEENGIDPQECRNIKQVHGKDIICTDNENSIKEADGLITSQKGTVLLIRTADCLPVFLFSTSLSCVCIVHAGWRGTQKGIVNEAVLKMKKDYGVDENDIRILFGPALRNCCYEVTDEFNGYFPDSVVRKSNKLYFDIIEENKKQLSTLGINEKQIADLNMCTGCSQKFFSYRKEGKAAGRMLSGIYLKKE